MEGLTKEHGECTYVCHNLYGYDLWVFLDLYGIKFGADWIVTPNNKCKFICTLDLSQSQWPDRPLPKGCPGSVDNPVTGKKTKIGPHSLEAWGYRLGNKKPVVHDWKNGDLHGYIHRCKEDVKLTKMVYTYLINEIRGKTL